MSLDLSEQGLKALPALKESLKELDANDNEIVDIEAVGACLSLETLLLYKNKIKAIPKCVGKLTGLKNLNLFNNVIKMVPDELGSLTELEEVNLASNVLMKVPTKALAGWTKVEVLNLYSNRIPTALLGSFSACTSLKELRLYENQLEAMPELGVCPSLEKLELQQNRITAIPDDYFLKTPNLKFLLMQKNALVGTFSASITKCQSMESLQLNENPGLTALPDGAYSPSLETLFIQDTAISKVPDALKGCGKMKRCNLGSGINNTTDALSKKLKEITLGNKGGVFWDHEGKKSEGLR